jgi:hypothetical protein
MRAFPPTTHAGQTFETYYPPDDSNYTDAANEEPTEYEQPQDYQERISDTGECDRSVNTGEGSSDQYANEAQMNTWDRYDNEPLGDVPTEGASDQYGNEAQTEASGINNLSNHLAIIPWTKEKPMTSLLITDSKSSI